MHQFKISVITPSFNSGDFIERAVNSVRNQHYKNVEHIIVDGGSTDSTIDFLKSNTDLIWISEPDKGQSDAMNKGFNISSGDIIVYLNADDYFLPDAFNSVIPLLKKGHKIVMGNVMVKQDWDDHHWINTPKHTFNEMLRHWELDAFCVNPVGYFFCKEVQEQVPLNINNHDAMDLEFLLETSLKFSITKIDHILGVFSFSKNCKTNKYQSKPDYWQPETWPFIEILAETNLEIKEFKKFLKLRNLGYQQRRQRIIHSLMHTEELEELIDEGKVLLFPTTDYKFQYQNNNTHSRVLPFNEFITPGDRIINVHQVGKVASTSIVMSLLNYTYNKEKLGPVYHTHAINPSYFPEVLKYNNTSINHYSSAFSRVFNKYKNICNWSFIAIVRDPIAIALSLIYELKSTNTKINNEDNNKSASLDELRHEVAYHLDNYILPYWNNDYRDANILDVYSFPFSKDRGWEIVEKENVSVLILSYEKINEIFPEAMETFMGITNLILPRKNVTIEKNDSIEKDYNNTKNNLKFDKEFLEKVYSHPFVTHFYSNNEISIMLKKWEKSEPFSIDSKNNLLSRCVLVAENWCGLIYDLGLNTGEDTDYYLRKGFKVVAVEANPNLVNEALHKFANEIKTGQLTILNFGISDEKNEGQKLKFYFNEYMTVWGSFIESLGWRSIERWFTKEQNEDGRRCIDVECISFANLISKFGIPYYTKIDIEGNDEIALKSMLNAGYKPKYISVEHGGEELLNLLHNAGYSKFKYIPMYKVSDQKVPIPAFEGLTISYNFAYGSSGAFGEDTTGDWLDFETVKYKSKYSNTKESRLNGHWFDVHASYDAKSDEEFSIIEKDKKNISNPDFSIITPILNASTHIKNAIQSVINQKYKYFELIFIDGGSTDETCNIIKHYQLQYSNIKLISEKDNGIYDAMNKGIEASSGEFLFFMGADDELFDEYVLSDLVASGIFYKNKIVYGNVKIKGNNQWAKDGEIYDGLFDLKKLLAKNICQQAIFYPRQIFNDLGKFDRQFLITADWDFNLRCFAKQEFLYTDRIISNFATGGISSGKEDFSIYLKFVQRIISYFNIDLSNPGIFEAESPFSEILSNYNKIRFNLNPTSDKIRNGISLFSASKNRSELLEKAMESWIMHDEIDEIIIVDWSSDDSLRPLIDKFKSDKIFLVRIEDQNKWVLSEACNLAARLTTCDKILKIDADVEILSGFFQNHHLKPGIFFTGNWELAKNENETHLNGSMFLYRNDFMKVGGYNEFLKTYGWDDSDLYNRLIDVGLERQDIVLDTLNHIEHGGRMIHQQKSVLFKHISDEEWSRLNIYANRFIINKIDNWSANNINSSLKILEKDENYISGVMVNLTENQLPDEIIEEGMINAIKYRLIDLGLSLPKEILDVSNEELIELFNLFLSKEISNYESRLYSLFSKLIKSYHLNLTQKDYEIQTLNIEILEEKEKTNEKEKIISLNEHEIFEKNQLLKEKVLQIEEKKEDISELIEQLNEKEDLFNQLLSENTELKQSIKILTKEIEEKIENNLQQNIVFQKELEMTNATIEEKDKELLLGNDRFENGIQNVNNLLKELESNERRKLVESYKKHIVSRLIWQFINFCIHPFSYYRNRRDALEVRHSGLFDDTYYLEQNPDLYLTTVDMLRHYMQYGWKEGRNPNPLFDSNFYLENNTDVARSRVNPLLHYIQHGKKEARKIRSADHSIKQEVKSPVLLESEKQGEISNERAMELILESGLFDITYYCKTYADIREAGVDPLFHFFYTGWKENRNPSENFNTKYYLKSNPDVASSGMNPLFHYILVGCAEGRSAKPDYNEETIWTMSGLFDADFYKEQLVFPPKEMSKVDHFINHGIFNEIAPNRRVAKKILDNSLHHPLISIIIPVYNSPIRFLSLAIDSVLNQIYQNWELIVVDDGSTSKETLDYLKTITSTKNRIHITLLEKNQGISNATNRALSEVKGDFIAFFDHDDLLTPNCLLEIVYSYNQNPETDVFYTDQTYIDENGNVTGHFYKPDWSPWMFRGVMYVCHLLVVRNTIIKEINGLLPSFDFIQDFEFMLRVSEKAKKIVHIPKTLYHWRQIQSSVAGGGKREIDFETLQSNAVNNHLLRLNIPVISKKNPIHPHRLILESTIDSSVFNVLAIIMTENVISENKSRKLIDSISSATSHKTVQWNVISIKEKNSITNLMNLINKVEYDYLLIINENCTPLDDTWLSRLLSFNAIKGIGSVGPMIINNEKVISSGLIVSKIGIQNAMNGFDCNSDGYAGSLCCIREVSTISPFCVVIKKEIIPQRNFILPELGIEYSIINFLFESSLKENSNLIIPQIKVVTDDISYFNYNKYSMSNLYWKNLKAKELSFGDKYYNRNFNQTKADFTI